MLSKEMTPEQKARFEPYQKKIEIALRSALHPDPNGEDPMDHLIKILSDLPKWDAIYVVAVCMIKFKEAYPGLAEGCSLMLLVKAFEENGKS